MTADRIVSAAPTSPNEEAVERALRPQRLAEYVGQPKIREQLDIFIRAARNRAEALDHVLLFGPPGLGKTTLAHIVAHEMGVNLRQTSGPVLERPGDLAALLTNLEKHDVLFIDEIHRLSPVVEEVLYPALEDFQIDIMIGEGPAARSIKLDLPPFTLVGATTRAGMLTNPLRDRFGIVARLEFYSEDDLAAIVARSARLLAATIDEAGSREIARRARGTPRIANRLLRRVRDYAEVRADGRITRPLADAALSMLEVDALGLDVMDRKLLLTHDREVLRRTGRHRQPRGGHRRGARHPRGCRRALPDPARPAAAHAARPRRVGGSLSPLRHHCSRRGRLGRAVLAFGVHAQQVGCVVCGVRKRHASLQGGTTDLKSAAARQGFPLVLSCATTGCDDKNSIQLRPFLKVKEATWILRDNSAIHPGTWSA